MNSSTVLTEERPTTSSVELERTYWRRILHVPMWCSQQVTASTATTLITIEPTVCFVTAPRIDFSGYGEIIATTPKIEVVYKNRASIEALLGESGKRVLEKVISLLEDMSQQQNWPLTHLEASPVKDVEVRDWQYVLLIFNFDSNFDTADKYLHDFYARLDFLADTLDEEEEGALRRMLFFDVETTI